MIKQPMKRSNEPVFWGLFGAGGMWSALVLPAVIVLIGFILPLGIEAEHFNLNTLLNFIHSWYGKLFTLITIILPLWCGLHRIHHCTHDLKIHFPMSKVIFYGIALLLSIAAIVGIYHY